MGQPLLVESYGRMFHSLPDGAALLDVIVDAEGAPTDFTFVDVNRAFHSLMGLPEGELAGRRLSELSFASLHLKRLASVATSGEPIRYDVYDAEIDRHLRVSASSAGAGRIGITLRDATAERIAEIERARWLEERAAVGSRPDRADELRNLERLFRSTVENIPINLILYDRELRILYVNPSLAAMANAFERSASAIIGRYGGDVWPEFVWTPLKIHCERSLRTGERQYYELDYRMPGGERVIRQWTVVPIGSVSGDIQQLLVMTHDLTAQRRLLNELQETDRRKSDFIAVLSHELRNPLAAIQSSLYVMERSPEGAERAIRARSVIGRQVNHLARLVDDLLDVTRIARDRVVLRREIVDLRQIVRQTLEDHSGHLQQGRVHLEMQLPGEPVLVNADPARVAQVVANLVSNATKFTPAGRRATVSVSHSDPEGIAVLRVVDSGIGIEPAFLPRLFVPFTQADLTLNRERGGLGLGLAVVKGLVELHGGAVQVHSEGQGKGTEVIVRLPLERAQSAQPHLSPTPTAGRRRVLVIEDDPDVLDSLRAALEIDDFEVQVAQAGAEGLEMARRFRPDVVLCDIGLPEMNGYEVARAFRSDPELRSTFLVALSGYAQAPDVAHAQEAGFDEHLPKPTTLRSVQGAIARAKPRRDQS